MMRCSIALPMAGSRSARRSRSMTSSVRYASASRFRARDPSGELIRAIAAEKIRGHWPWRNRLICPAGAIGKGCGKIIRGQLCHGHRRSIRIPKHRAFTRLVERCYAFPDSLFERFPATAQLRDHVGRVHGACWSGQ